MAPKKYIHDIVAKLAIKDGREAAFSAYKKLRHTIQMTNDRPVYILPLFNYNAYWPIIGHLYCMKSFFIRHI